MRLITSVKRKTGQYLFDHAGFHDLESFRLLDESRSICIPLAIDTEFYVPHYTDPMACGVINGRLPVTFQVNHIHSPDQGKIFVYPDFATYCRENNQPIRHPILKHGFVAIDYLEARGYQCELTRNPDYEELKQLPVCEFVFYAHFAIAELYLLTLYDSEDPDAGINVFRDDLNYHVLKHRIQFGKRTYCQTTYKQHTNDSIYTNWQLKIEGKSYRIRLAIFDTAALHGSKSYKVLAANAGVRLESKDLMKGRIEKMHIAYHEVPKHFDDYALGDLKTYEILERNAMNFENVYTSLGISTRYSPPKLSIGATVANIFRAKLGELFQVEGKELSEVIERYCRKGNAQYLLTKRSLTSCYLAKVDGGRCRNNRPLDTLIEGALCDLDISGCYGEGQRSQLYPIGNPLILEFPLESKINRFPSLREFLNSVRYGTDDCQLVYGLWFARVNTRITLQFEQDFVSSWFDPSFNSLHASDDQDVDEADNETVETLDVKTGHNKILLNEIKHGILQADFLDWLFNVCGTKQQAELLDFIYVESAILYPKSEQCHSIEELLSRTRIEEGENTCILEYKSLDDLTRKIMTECESYAWYGVNLGDFIIDDLIARRKTFPKKNGDGSVNSFNELYKLLVNTLYGIMASPFFDISNTTVGNNITARARALAYYIEKGLYACQIITDGGTFDLNKVVWEESGRKWKVAADDYATMYRTSPRNLNANLRSLGGYTRIDIIYPANQYPVLCFYQRDDLVKCLQGKKAEQWINEQTFKHLQNLFPNVTVLHGQSTTLKIRNNHHDDREYVPRVGMYEFEMKDFYTRGIFHSSANYWLTSIKASVLKMRSYEKKKHDAVRVIDGEIHLEDTFSRQTPAEYFMKQLANPSHVERGHVFAKDTILKIGEYVQRQDSLYSKSILIPGDTTWRLGLLREFSLSQFTFRTIKQFKEWEKLIDKLKDKHGQSLEMFFINRNDGTLNYQAMIEWFDHVIDIDLEPSKALRKLSKDRVDHPEFMNLVLSKREFAKRANTYDYLYGDSE